MFAEFGGIAPSFELLQEFQCIELIAEDNASASSQSYAPAQSVEPQVAALAPMIQSITPPPMLANEDDRTL